MWCKRGFQEWIDSYQLPKPRVVSQWFWDFLIRLTNSGLGPPNKPLRMQSFPLALSPRKGAIP
jgi:hypothetical protein